MYNPELLFIKILLNKDLFNKYKDYVDYKSLEDNYREIYFLYKTLKDLHEKHDKSFSLEELAVAFFTAHPNADRRVYEGLLNQLQAAEIGEEVSGAVLDQIIARKRFLKLSELSFQVAQGLRPKDDLETFLNETPAAKVEEQEFPLKLVSTDVEELLNNVYSEQGLRWRLDCLNKSLGSLRDGDFGFIFARPETGKTTFLSSEVSYMLTQSERAIVWFNNEEDGDKVMLRVIQAFFGITLEQLLSNIKRFKDEFSSRTKNRFFFFDSGVIDKRAVETIIKRLNPCLVVYDQIDKIRGFAADRDDLRLGTIYQWARELAKGNHAAIGVCQADGHAEGVRYLTMEHVANAKTSKQAEADFIIGIGRSDDEKARFLNISKNKLLGDKDTIPELRHGRFETLIEPTIARYQDVIRFE